MVFYTVTNGQRLMHPAMDDPGTVRLVRVRDGALVGASGVVDFFGGANADVAWLMAQTGEVGVGRDILFVHVPPLDAAGARLPIAHERGTR